MADPIRRQEALAVIRRNIERSGKHIYVVLGAPTPQFAYTIGFHDRLAAELVIAGCYFYSADQLIEILNRIGKKIEGYKSCSEQPILLEGLGRFSLREAHTSWVSLLLLGAFDYYDRTDIRAYQIVPDDEHWTTEIPDLREPWNAKTAGAWRSLKFPWDYPVPANSVALTNIDALSGEKITEVMRWENDEWEIFAGAGPDVLQQDRRVVPLSVLLAADESLLPAVNLAVGTGLWRDTESPWHAWRASAG